MLRNLIHPFLLWHNYNTKENLKWAAIEVLSRTCAKFNLRKSWSHYWKKHTMKKYVEHSLELTVCKRATFCLIKGGYLSFTFWSLSQYVWVILSQKPEFLLQVTINFCIVIDFGYRSLDFIWVQYSSVRTDIWGGINFQHYFASLEKMTINFKWCISIILSSFSS